MNVHINPDACIGCGICASLCASTFAMGPDNKAHVLEAPADSEKACAIGAVKDCPTEAIRVQQTSYA